MKGLCNYPRGTLSQWARGGRRRRNCGLVHSQAATAIVEFRHSPVDAGPRGPVNEPTKRQIA